MSEAPKSGKTSARRGARAASASSPEQPSAARKTPPAGEKPHHLGHRQRLRERFAAGPEAVPDYELLEIVLFRSIARGDVKGIAKALIARFGSFAEVIAAPENLLAEVKGVGPAIVHDLKLIEESARRIAFGAVKNRQVLSSYTAVVEYCRTAMAFAEVEEFRLLLLDKKNGLIGDEMMHRGTVDHTPVYPREIVRRALQLNASAVILVHNHPTRPFLITMNHAQAA